MCSTSGWNCTPASRAAEVLERPRPGVSVVRATTVKPSGASDTASSCDIHTCCSRGRPWNSVGSPPTTSQRGPAELRATRCAPPCRRAPAPSPGSRSRCRTPGRPASNIAGSTDGAPGGVDRRRAAGQDDRRRPLGQHLGHRHRVRDDLAVDPSLADPPRDQLRVLRPEVDDEDGAGGVRRRCHASILPRRPGPALRRKRALFRRPSTTYRRSSCAPSPTTTPAQPDVSVAGALPALDRAPAAGHPAARRGLRRDLDGRAGTGACRDRPRPADRGRRRRPVRGRPSGRWWSWGSPWCRPCSASCGTGSRWRTGWRASFRAMQLLGRHSALVGVAIRRRLPTGEVVAAATNDALHIGGAFDVTGPARRGDRLVRRRRGHAAAHLGAARRRRAARRARDGAAARPAAASAAAAAGRAARGRRPAHRARRRHGRRPAGAARHRRRAGLPAPLPHPVARAAAGRRPRRVAAGHPGRRPGAAARASSWCVVTWLSARLAVEGTIDVGDVVAFYGYAFFLVIPIRTAVEAADKMTRSLVGAKRIVAVLVTEPGDPGPGAAGRRAAVPRGPERPALRPARRARDAWSGWSAATPTSRPRSRCGSAG